MVEISSVNSSDVREWASAVNLGRKLTEEQKNISESVDAWAKSLAKGNDGNSEIAAFISKTMEDTTYNYEQNPLNMMLDEDSVGEFDDYEIVKKPKNTLLAYEVPRGGNVDKSYIDFSAIRPTWKHLQVETEIKYSDLKRNGFKSIATLTEFAQEALLNKKLAVAYNAALAAHGAPTISISGGATALTKTAMDELSLFVLDSVEAGDTPFVFGLNKYAQAIANMTGYTSFMSDKMKDDYNKFGLVKEYGGMLIAGFSANKKTADGNTVIPNQKLIAVAGKCGVMAERGELEIFQTPNNNAEKYDLKFSGADFGVLITKPEKVNYISFTA